LFAASTEAGKTVFIAEELRGKMPADSAGKEAIECNVGAHDDRRWPLAYS